MATWNVRSLYESGKSRVLEMELEKYRIDVAAIQEIRWKEVQMVNLKRYMVINSGHTRNIYGTGFFIKKELKHTVMDYQAINERICYVRLRGKFFNLSLISVHAPTEDKSDEEKETFYDELNRFYDNIPNYDVKLILGDLNAKIGKEQAFYPVIGRYSKHESSNDNGLRLIDFAAEKGMKIMSTCYQHKEIHKETWTSPDGITKNQIDHVLVDVRHATDVLDVRSLRGADCSSDHFMVRAKYRQRLAVKSREVNRQQPKYCLERFKNESMKEKYQGKIKERLGSLKREGTIDDRWQEIGSVITSVAEEVLGYSETPPRNDWFDDECVRLAEKKNLARKEFLQKKTRASKERYKAFRLRLKKVCRKKKRESEKRKLLDIQNEFGKNNNRQFFKEIKNMKAGFQETNPFLRDENECLLADRKDILNRWRRYFQTLLNGKPGRSNAGERVDENMEEEEEDIQEPPELEEVREAIENVKNNKAAGEDGIPVELLKYGGEDLEREMYNIIWSVWMEEKMPKRWSKCLICPVFKKGKRDCCENYRGISLLGVAYKVFATLLLDRLRLWINKEVGDYQTGFREGRSTVDHIFSIRIMLEKCHEYNVPLHHLFIDLQQAYDSVDQTELLNWLDHLGFPKKLVRLTRMILLNSIGCVKAMGAVSDDFPLTKGLRQGDPLSPLLFNLALEKVFRAIRTNPGGTIYNRLSQHLAYADDVVVTARTIPALLGVYEEFSREASTLGLAVNVSKTKYMSTSKQNNEDVVTLGDFETVREFRYLGSVITTNNVVSVDVKARIAAGNRCFWALQKALKFKQLSRKAKLVVYKTILRSIVVYGSETWTLTLNDEKLLNIWERKILRKVFGPVKEGDSWRMRSNQELKELYRDQDIVSVIKSGRLRWLGHLQRMEEGRIPKKLFTGHPGGRRKRGRPRLRWLDDVEEDLRVLGVRRWRQVAQDREEWRRVVAEAKAL